MEGLLSAGGFRARPMRDSTMGTLVLSSTGAGL